MVTVLKLGGSVITDKDEPETADRVAISRAAQSIESALREGSSLVIVHGGGSFGHHHAARHGVSTESGTHDSTQVCAIHRAMCELNEIVLDGLHEKAVDAVPVRPLSVASRSQSAAVTFPVTQLQRMLAEGFTPVIPGDVIVHETKGATVLSGDTIVVDIAQSLDADRVGLCSTVPGVLDRNDEVVPEINRYGDVAEILGESESTDVTGGMAGKIKRLLALDVPASVFDLDSLDTFLDTGQAGTVVR